MQEPRHSATCLSRRQVIKIQAAQIQLESSEMNLRQYSDIRQPVVIPGLCKSAN
jgi:hypothetical protein